MASEPHEIIRLKDIGKYLGLAPTQVEAIIKRGLLQTFSLSPGGRAKGVTKQALIEYQARYMGLRHDVE
jgi:hypothetical protein